MKTVLVTTALCAVMALWLWFVSSLWVSYTQWPVWYIYAASALIGLVITAQGVQLARQHARGERHNGRNQA